MRAHPDNSKLKVKMFRYVPSAASPPTAAIVLIMATAR